MLFDETVILILKSSIWNVKSSFDYVIEILLNLKIICWWFEILKLEILKILKIENSQIKCIHCLNHAIDIKVIKKLCLSSHISCHIP